MSGAVRDADPEGRVLVFAPVGRDAELTRALLARASIPCLVCRSTVHLRDELFSNGAAALLLTEEALDESGFPTLAASLERQPPWSDVPILLFAGGPGAEPSRGIRSFDTLRSVTLLERPIRVAAVLSAVRAALRSRARQYEVRDLLIALHRARTEAESANRLKDEFLATLSHELRTPLNAILGWTSMLARGQVEPDRLPRVFETLDRNAQSQAQLIADVLDVSRIITGKLRLETAPVDLCDVIARAVDAVRPAAAAKRVAVTLRDPQPCYALGDADRLQQVFWNLLTNAVKFTPPGGTIAVDVTRDGDRLVVGVTDTGIGIPPEFVPFVFDRFRQADQTTTRTHGGLGLGLSIVKHLIELHGGSVSATSDGTGRGARFEVRLPAAEAPGTAFVPEMTEPAGVVLDGRLVLIVDDDESTRDVLSAALEAVRARVQVAASAAEARQRLAEQTPTVIIADLGMPLEDGFSFIRSLRQSSAPRVPAIALSAYADPASRAAALAAGFDAFLAKPARAHTVVELVWSVLNRPR